MTDDELQQLVRQISQKWFSRSFEHQALFNHRLKTTGGRYVLASHNIEINPLMLIEHGQAVLIGIIKHELIHYHQHISGLPYQHRDIAFKKELKRVGALRYAPATSYRLQKQQSQRNYHLYTCINGHAIRRQRYINVNRYRCGLCHGKLRLMASEAQSK
ncbi:SprT family protein [Weissella diestrammenae]|uniref:SprT family protein n=1 Tax=Weissella diestrammenae TaxID=1162633 RepID=A0A7G9T5C6_9LACO|nr:SprT family protein [Weissella diestrammenae]MCM0583160.1 SprT family protein [Weissella diestrammenae]QNN75301.1 SprT family protein [Weissella diestrammenae]